MSGAAGRFTFTLALRHIPNTMPTQRPPIGSGKEFALRTLCTCGYSRCGRVHRRLCTLRHLNVHTPFSSNRKLRFRTGFHPRTQSWPVQSPRLYISSFQATNRPSSSTALPIHLQTSQRQPFYHNSRRRQASPHERISCVRKQRART